MNLFESITQSELNDAIDLLLNNYHREINLNIDDSSNDYCTLEFDLSDGVDAGDEIIFNNGDNLGISISDKRLALMGYTLRFFYYKLDKGDYTGSKDYGELQSFDVKLDEDTVTVPFTDNQIYLQKNFDLILLKDVGYRLLLSASSSIVLPGDDVVLTADYTYGSVPVEDASVEFYNGETLIDTVDTDEDGLAVCTVSDLPVGSYNFNCICNNDYSGTVNVIIVSNNVMELEVTGSGFETYSSSPFTCNGRVFVDWGDDTGLIEYAGGKLTHTYSSSDDYTVKIYGDITSLKLTCFYNCTGLTSVIIPDSVTSLGINCFNSCTGLTSIVIPSSVTSIGSNCFRGCIGLTSITLPNTIASLSSACFLGCTSLTSIVIPSSVTSLGNYCFDNCTGLTSISIPDGVTSIGNHCFRGCTGLTEIVLNWDSSSSIIEYNSSWINGCTSFDHFLIPQGTTNIYAAKAYQSNKLVERTS